MAATWSSSETSQPDAERLVARAGQFAVAGLEGVFVDVSEDHGGAGLGEGLGGGQAHAGAAAGDQSDLAGEVIARVHTLCPFRWGELSVEAFDSELKRIAGGSDDV